MTLELNQIASQVKAMGENIASRYQEKHSLIHQAKTILKTYSTAFTQLEERITQAEKIQEKVRFNWLGAAPAGEPLAEYYPPPPLPANVNIIASDGSQIYLDQHSIALYYLVNIGAIVYRHGSNSRPDTCSESQLYYEPEKIFNELGLIIPNSVVNVDRDIAEITMLAKLAPAYNQPNIPVVALIDGQLTLRIIDLLAPDQQKYQTIYLQTLTQLQEQQTIVAAYIDRPRSSFVLSLLHLANLATNAINEQTLRHNPFLELIDTDLFNDLNPGYRTAIFNQRAKANIAYAKRGHHIHFFYLNTGTAQKPNLARVEIPIWIAEDTEKLNTLHATLLHQAAITKGYPYVLARAHELAIITPSEKEALETLLTISLRKQGLLAEISQKQWNKSLLKNKEGFKL